MRKAFYEMIEDHDLLTLRDVYSLNPYEIELLNTL